MELKFNKSEGGCATVFIASFAGALMYLWSN